MIGGPAGRRRRNTIKAQCAKIEFVDEHLDDTNRIVLGDVVFKTIGKQCRLPAILAFDKTLHPDLSDDRESLYQINAFPHRLDPLLPFKIGPVSARKA